MVQLGVYEKSLLILFRTLTPLHVGIGRRWGVVELPVERDGYGFFYIPSTGIKGAIRERFKDDKNELMLFGSSPRAEERAAGCFAPLDANLISIPARSLKGVYCLSTCALALRRLRDFCDLTGAVELEKRVTGLLEKIPPGSGEVLVSERGRSEFEVDGKIIINEEIIFPLGEIPEVENFGSMLSPDDAWRVAVIPDTAFRFLAERSLIKRARIKLEKEKKTTEPGSLWTEEDVPSNTFFVAPLLFTAPRGIQGEVQTAEGVCEIFENKILPEGKGYLILGGHETVGRGLIEVRKLS